MKILRTPDRRFVDLPDYPFEPHYVELPEDGLRVHYVDQGPSDAAETVLMLHGEPSWSYLYRFMIPPVAAAGHRVIAPDLVGFGKSDKPRRKADYSYERHLGWLRQALDALELPPVTLFCQDWGSLLGLRLVAEEPERFARVVVGNGFLPTGTMEMPKAFQIWKRFALHSPWFPIGRIVDKGSRRQLKREEIRAYNAPFPSPRYKASARSFPALVPVERDDPGAAENRAAWERLRAFDKPFLTTFSTGDPIMRGGDSVFQREVPGCAGLPHRRVKGGHFLQEDSGPELAQAILDLIATT